MKGFALKFSDLHNWAIPGRSVAATCPPGWRPLKLGHILQQVKHRDRIAPDRQYAMAGVKWYGEGVFLRETVLGAGMSASQVYPLVPGALIYNRLFAWKASFAVVPACAAEWHVSTEFPQFKVDPALATPEFLRLFCLTQPTLDTVNRASAGSAAVSRNRLKESAFLDLDIALPPLTTQRAIVAHWDMVQADAAMTEREAEGIEREATAAFLSALGFVVPNAQPRPRALAVKWSQVAQWGVDKLWQSMQPVVNSSYPSVSIQTIASIGSGGTPSRRVPSYYNGTIPWVKTTEVRNGFIHHTEEQITPAGLANSSAKIYPATSLVIAMYGQGATRARTAKLAIDAATNQACCVLHSIDQKIQTDFLWFFLMSQYENLRSLASGNNQPNLNAGMIANYQVPLPPLKIQTALVAGLTAARVHADALRAQARERRETARAEVEAMILGHMPAPTTTSSATPLPPFGHPLPQGERGKQKPLS